MFLDGQSSEANTEVGSKDEEKKCQQSSDNAHLTTVILTGI